MAIGRIGAPGADLKAHEDDTTNIHGITDTSQLVNVTLVDAAGDLLVGSGADALGRLALGTNGYVLTVDTSGSGVAKIKWAAPAESGLNSFLLMGA